MLQFMPLRQRALALVACVVLSACGGGGGGNDSSPNPTPTPGPTTPPGGNSICRTIGGGGAVATSDTGTCSDCSVGALEAAIDGSLSSAATLTIPTSGTVTLRGTAQQGVVLPAGTNAGAFVQKPLTVDGASFTLTLRTYLQGVPQESLAVFTRVGANDASAGTQVSTDAGNYYGFNTTTTFDAIEVELSRTVVTEGPDFAVYEICTRE